MTPALRSPTDALTDLNPRELVARWDADGWRVLSDAELVTSAARRLVVPRQGPADSFVLHAPLELMARGALLHQVAPDQRERARQRLVWVAATFEQQPAVDIVAVTASGLATVATLRAAVDAGDLDEADRVAAGLAGATSAAGLVGALADLLVARLSAAGHGSIFLYHLSRLAAPDAALMVRGLVREVARHPDWELTWMNDRDRQGTPTGDLFERLLDHPDVGDPGSHFIFPTMSLVEQTGLAAALLGPATDGLSVPEARRDLVRVAALAMLQDDPDHAAYGWSHALTMPQATLGAAAHGEDPGRAVAVAATHVLGFRATLGTRRLDPQWTPPPPPAAVEPATFLDSGPDGAAGAMWHAPDAELAAYVRQLTTYAACHSDAHLAKYTLACLDATRDDPGAGRLYLAAAGFLAGWWRTRGHDDDLFA